MASINNLGVLLISPFFSPNIGGVETHLDDLVTFLQKSNIYTSVHTYSPLTIHSSSWKSYESKGNIEIHRYKWISGNFFNIFENFLIIQFLYLVPYLFLRTVIWMVFNHNKISVIHSHGISAAIIGYFLSNVFHKKHIISIHAIYDYLDKVSPFVIFLLNHSSQVYTLSQASKDQLISWGVNQSKLSVFSYWIDLDRFNDIHQADQNIFTFLFVGRLISRKGINLFLDASKHFPEFQFIVIGSGPESTSVARFSKSSKNVKYIGQIDNHQLTKYLTKSSVLCVPSLYKEGFGRVIMEALACGIPVIASNLGGIPEALDSSVSILFKPNIQDFSNAIKTISDIKTYNKLKVNCRKYALKHFSSSNANIFLQAYKLS